MLQWEHSAILSTCIKLPFVSLIFILSIFEWSFKTGFTVVYKGLNLNYIYFAVNDPLNGAKGAYVKNCYVSDSATGTKYYTVDEHG